MKVRTPIKLLFTIVITLILNGCYEDYLFIQSKLENGKINQDSSKLIFFHNLQASLPPKGISRFPDGGRHKILYKNLSLYYLNLTNNELNKIYDFGNLPGSWMGNISLQNNKIVFNINPSMGCNWRLKHSSDTIYKNLYTKHMGFFLYDLMNKTLNRYRLEGYNPKLSPDRNQIIYLKKDSSNLQLRHFTITNNANQLIKNFDIDNSFIPIIWIDNEHILIKENKIVSELNLNSGKLIIVNSDALFNNNDISGKKIKEITSQFSFQEWGFKLSDHWKKKKSTYIKDVVLLNGNLNYRKLILEELSETLNKEEVYTILNRMNEYGNSLEGLQKTEYEIFSQETIDLLYNQLNKY